MLADIEDPEGTAYRASMDNTHWPASVCAKRGRLRRASGRRMDHTTWFASYGPTKNPRYVVIVMVEDGGSAVRLVPGCPANLRAIQSWSTRRP